MKIVLKVFKNNLLIISLSHLEKKKIKDKILRKKIPNNVRGNRKREIMKKK